jgi:hypothetical protein
MRDAVWDWLWFLFWGVAASIWCVSAAEQLGATFDEPFYVSAGLEHWRTGSHSELLRLGTMPLPVDVQTLPIYLWERWRGEPFNAEADLDALLPWARAATLGFLWLLLFYGRLAGRQLAGPWGGRLAVALLACEPSLLAHAGLATTDLALTACVLAFTYHFFKGRGAAWRRRVGVPAIWFGIAVLAKASAVAFCPLCMLAIELDRLGREESRGLRPPFAWWSRLRPLRRDGFQIASLGMVLVFIYCGSDWQPQATFLAWAHGLPDGVLGRSMVWTAEHLRIFRNAGDALARQTSHNVRGHGVYLLGRTDPRAFWYYFPVLLTIKLSLPLLLAPLALGVVNRRSLANWACWTAVILLAFSLVCRVQIGVRLVLPLVAFAIVGLAAAIVQTSWTMSWHGRKLVAGVIAAGLVWTCWSDVDVWPNGLCYTNEAWGDTTKGYLYVSESNYDWGQGLKELEAWRQQQCVATLDVWYFGADPDLNRLPLQPLPLHTFPIESARDVTGYLLGRRVAVSTTLLYGLLPTTTAHQQSLELLRACRPVDRTTTFLIYDFTPDADGRPVSIPKDLGQNTTASR